MAASTWFTDPDDPRIWRSEYSYVRRFGPEAAGAPPAKKACYRWTGSRWSAAATDEYDEPSKRRDAQTSSIADGVLGKEEVVLDLEDPSGPSLRLYKIEGEKEIFKYINRFWLEDRRTAGEETDGPEAAGPPPAKNTCPGPPVLEGCYRLVAPGDDGVQGRAYDPVAVGRAIWRAVWTETPPTWPEAESRGSKSHVEKTETAVSKQYLPLLVWEKMGYPADRIPDLVLGVENNQSQQPVTATSHSQQTTVCRVEHP